jgi:hypothetical protein
MNDVVRGDGDMMRSKRGGARVTVNGQNEGVDSECVSESEAEVETGYLHRQWQRHWLGSMGCRWVIECRVSGGLSSVGGRSGRVSGIA